MAVPTAQHGEHPLARARALAGSGRFKQARAAYKQAVRALPGDAEVLSEFGAVEAECGNPAAARRLMEKALRLAPRDPAIRFNLGELERQAERWPQARQHFEAVLAVTPDDADALFGLGVAQLMQGDAAAAHGTLEKAHRLSPRDPGILNELGNALAAVSRERDAVPVFARALELDPNHHQAAFNLAMALCELDRYGEADTAFARADAIEPIPNRSLWKWAQAQVHIGKHEEALANTERALAIDPDIPQAYFVRGVAMQHHGRFDEAERNFRAALDLRDDVAEAYEKLALIKRLDLEDTGPLERILADDQQYKTSTRASAGFTLYQLYHKAGDRDAAFRALSAANRLKAAITPFDADNHVEITRHLTDIFDADFFRRRAGEGDPSNAPIFVLGMPRSGTTLTEQILAAYPQVHGGGEQLVLQEFVKRTPGYPDVLRDVPADWARGHAADLLRELCAGAEGAPRVTDKTPGNYMCIGLIAWLFPNAKVVYCRRDGRDIGFSCFEQNFNAGLSFAYDLDAFVVAYRCHRQIMAYWQRTAPIEVLDLDYERLVSAPEQEARRLVEFCDLEWDERCLDTAGVERSVQTASFWQVRQPINTGSIAKWRRYEEHLADFADRITAVDAESFEHWPYGG